MRPHILTLDIDGLPVEVFGHQSGSSYLDQLKAKANDMLALRVRAFL